MSVVQLFNQIAHNEFGFFRRIREVADLLHGGAKSVTLDDSVEHARDLMRRHRLHHVPVVDPEDGRLLGIVSDRDLLRHFPRLLGTAAEQDNDHRMLSDNVTRIMTRNPLWCPAETSVVDAMTLMIDRHVDSLMISPDGHQLTGVLTTRDFLRTLLLYHRVCTREHELRRLRLVDLDFKSGVPLDQVFTRGAQTVRDVMTRNVETLTREDSVAAAIHRMQDAGIRHLPVTTADGQVTGRWRIPASWPHGFDQEGPKSPFAKPCSPESTRNWPGWNVCRQS
jgi:acetoin utilization protein AcuB